MDVEHPGQTDGHVAIAAEIEIDLQGVGKDRDPGLPEGQFRHDIESLRHPGGKGVGQDQLLEEPDREKMEARRQVQPVRLGAFRLVELRHHLVVQDDRAGQQMGEEQDIQRVVQQRIADRGLAAVAIDQIGNLAEGEEADGQWQHHVLQHPLRPKHVIDIRDEEIVVLEESQQADIDQDPEQQQPLPAAMVLLQPHPPANREIEEDGECDQDQVDRLEPAIEEQRGRHQPQPGGDGHPLAAAQQIIANQNDWKKDEDEFVGIEKHIVSIRGSGFRGILLGAPSPSPASCGQLAAGKK